MTNILRFVAARPAEIGSTDAVDLANLDSDAKLTTELEAAGSEAKRQQIARKFEKSDNYIDDSTELPEFYAVLEEGILEREKVGPADVRELVRNAYREEIDKVWDNSGFATFRRRAVGSYLAAVVLRLPARRILARALRLIDLIREAREATADSAARTVADILTRPILLPTSLFEDGGGNSASKGEAESSAEPQAVAADIAALRNAHREVSRLAGRDLSLAVSERPGEVKDDDAQAAAAIRILSDKGLGKLSEGSRSVLSDLGEDLEATAHKQVLAALEAKIAEAEKEQGPQLQPMNVVVSNGYAYSVPVPVSFSTDRSLAVSGGVGGMFQPAPPPLPLTSGEVHVLGVGELMLVREQKLSYELTEVAHIENVLKGESKERSHRRLFRSEETTETEEIHISESEKDVQTTDRYELQTETSKAAETQAQLEGSMSVSASYGPTVSVGVDTGFSLASSTQTAASTATSYSQEIVERAAERIREEIREKRTRTLIEEVEELNRHGIDNKGGSGHVTGIYRWVDKVYEAQVIRYGKRLMLEFVVPEPSTLLLHSMSEAEDAAVLEKPPDLTIAPDDLQPWNYRQLAAAYGAEGVVPAPASVITRGHVFAFQGESGGEREFQRDFTVVEIPEGYAATTARLTLEWAKTGVASGSGDAEPPPYCRVGIGGMRRVMKDHSDHRVQVFELDGEIGQIPVAATANYYGALTITVEIECERTPLLVEVWQNQMFDRIKQASERRTADYERKLAALSTNSYMTGGFGANPGRNRLVEKRELKRAAVSILTGQHYDSFGSVANGADGLPQINFPRAKMQGRYISFFEQSVEWDQMSYVFYPYFWAAKRNWRQLLQLDDPDSLFTRFLQAGSARVVVPVRPGFEASIISYLQFGDVPQSAEDGLDGVSVPYLPIVEEIRSSDFAEPEEGEIGASWKVRIPTNLVYLQASSDLP